MEGSLHGNCTTISLQPERKSKCPDQYPTRKRISNFPVAAQLVVWSAPHLGAPGTQDIQEQPTKRQRDCVKATAEKLPSILSPVPLISSPCWVRLMEPLASSDTLRDKRNASPAPHHPTPVSSSTNPAPRNNFHPHFWQLSNRKMPVYSLPYPFTPRPAPRC